MLKFAGILPRNKTNILSNYLDNFFLKLNLCNPDIIFVFVTKITNSNNFSFFVGKDSNYIKDKDTFQNILEEIQQYDVEHLNCELQEENVPDFFIYKDLIEQCNSRSVVFVNIPQPYQINALDELTSVLSEIFSNKDLNIGLICSGLLSQGFDLATSSIFEQTETTNICNYFLKALTENNLEILFTLTKDIIQNKYNIQESFFGPFWLLLSILFSFEDIDIRSSVYKNQDKVTQVIGTLYSPIFLSTESTNDINQFLKDSIIAKYLEVNTEFDFSLPKGSKEIFIKITDKENKPVFIDKSANLDLIKITEKIFLELQGYSVNQIFDMRFNVVFLSKKIKEYPINSIHEFFNFDYIKINITEQNIFISLKDVGFDIFRKYHHIEFGNAVITGFTIS